MSEPVEVARELYAAVAAGDREGVATRLAPQVRWEGRERGPRWRRRRSGCSGADDATAAMVMIGRKLPTVRPRAFQAAGDRVLVGLWADTMERRPMHWWTVLTIRDGQVTTIEDHRRHRDAVRTLPPTIEAAP
ncbi:MAG TPA: nuclear transport factor 2 family protein [Solirubrobacteraceae bacterium]|nr:nuclear transport factor 2 family protein [Solirubrobacteraceae bacterium]